jgi:hypothetical protein
MAFRCPDCSGVNSLAILRSIELPADSRSDEITVQITACRSCGFRGLAVYEESRRGALDRESVDHRGYRVDPQTFARYEGMLRRCPSPRDPHCGCKTHQILSAWDARGRWVGQQDLDRKDSFPMEVAGL